MYRLSSLLVSMCSPFLTCKAAIPTPLEYTRGTLVPITLSAIGQDGDSSNLPLSPDSWSFSLSRHTKLANSDSLNSAFVETVAKGRTWETNNVDSPAVQLIKGEIGIPKATRPTFHFPSFSVSVRIFLSCPVDTTLRHIIILSTPVYGRLCS